MTELDHEEAEFEQCIACEIPLMPGDMVLSDANGGLIHAACCGPERESYVGADGEPLKDGDPIPAPWQWQPDLRECPHCGCRVSLEPSHNAPETLYVFICPAESPCRHSGLGTYAIASQLPRAIAMWNRPVASALSQAIGAENEDDASHVRRNSAV